MDKRIAAAAKRIPADLVVKNGRIIDVVNREIITGDLAITDGVIVGIGGYEGEQVIDAEDRLIAPGLIDGHVHIESAMVTPSEFAKVVVPHGVTTVVADPHEIANVSGADGIQFMLDDSEDVPLDVFIALPSCVPATAFENAGARLTAEDLRPFYEHPRVIGLGEVMDFPAVRDASADMLRKIRDAEAAGKNVDGHAAGLAADDLNVYAAAGIRTDHEAVNAPEARERLRRGMYLMLREGSAAKDLAALVSVVNERNARRCLFVTDDKHLDDLVTEGSIDHHIRKAVRLGVEPMLALQMATLNAAECFGMKRKGLIAPGCDADFLLLDGDLTDMDIHEVYKSGKLAARAGTVVSEGKTASSDVLKDSVKLKELGADQLSLRLADVKANVIEITPNSLHTKHRVLEADVADGHFQPSTEKDLLKMSVVERHHRTGNVGLGIVKGFGLTAGAIATTIAHDSHNLLVIGTNDDDMLAAIREIKHIQGGIVIVKDGRVLASLALPIGGLMSDAGFREVAAKLEKLNETLPELGFQGDFNPFLTLSFLALPVIPELKLTDLGLFNVTNFKHIDIQP
ncbi:MAG TPA: adenine deaminase [Bacillales bacterium]|nr:adenine deaminase [Bacillales bacterium]